MLVVKRLQLFLIKKLVKLKNKIPDVSGLLMETVDDAAISEIEKKYFTTSDYNKFTCNILMQR